jgi:ergosteryl-3beta-O-L-aspartate synthase
MTGYNGLVLEMEIDWHYHEAMWTIDSALKHIFQGLHSQNRTEIETMNHHFPHEDLVWLEQTPRLTFVEEIKLLNDSGWRNDEGEPQSEFEDLSTRAGKALGAVVKETYHTDYYILDKFPASARPFYTMLDPNDSRITISFDFMVRGQEILPGDQRIHDAEMLVKRMTDAGVEPSTLRDYIQAFS